MPTPKNGICLDLVACFVVCVCKCVRVCVSAPERVVCTDPAIQRRERAAMGRDRKRSDNSQCKRSGAR